MADGSRHDALLNPGLSKGEFVALLYKTVFERDPDPEGLASNVAALDSISRESLIQSFLTSSEYKAKAPTNDAFVKNLYIDLLGRDADLGGLSFWLGQLDTGVSRGFVAANFVQSLEFGATNTSQISINGLVYSGKDSLGQVFKMGQFIDNNPLKNIVVKDIPDGYVKFYSNKEFIDPNLPTYVYSNGWTGSGKLSDQKAAAAFNTFLNKYGSNANIISVDWELLAKKQPGETIEPTLVSTVLTQVGETVADALERTGVNIGKTTLIGLSLGAHVMSAAAKEIVQDTGEKIAELVAIDPAAGGPGLPAYDLDARNGVNRGKEDGPIALTDALAHKTTSYVVMDQSNWMQNISGEDIASSAADTVLAGTADNAYLVAYTPLNPDLVNIAGTISNYHVGVLPAYLDLVSKNNLDPKAVVPVQNHYDADGTIDQSGAFSGIIATNQPWLGSANTGIKFPKTIAWVDNVENPTLYGTSSNDVLFLTQFDNPVKNGITFLGGAGNDLIGGYGKIDTYIGGAGSDIFFLGFTKDSKNVLPYMENGLFNKELLEYAVIKDFNGKEDTINFGWAKSDITFTDSDKSAEALKKLYGPGIVAEVNGDAVAYIVGATVQDISNSIETGHINFSKFTNIDQLLLWS